MKNTIYFFLAKDYRMMSSGRQRAWCFRRYGRQLVSKHNSRDFVEKNVGGATEERIRLSMVVTTVKHITHPYCC